MGGIARLVARSSFAMTSSNGKEKLRYLIAQLEGLSTLRMLTMVARNLTQKCVLSRMPLRAQIARQMHLSHEELKLYVMDNRDANWHT